MLAAVKQPNSDYFVKNDVLFHKDVVSKFNVEQIVIPEPKRKHILTVAHDSEWLTHYGSQKTILRIKLHFHWPGLVRDTNR